MVSGSLRATDTIYSTTNQFQILRIPTSSNGTTYGPGTNGQILKSNGTSVYWASDNATDSTKLPLAGGTLSGDLLFSDSGTNVRQIRGISGGSDYWRIAGGATASNAGWMEIATADDGTEPIYVRQYTGVFTTVKRTLTLLDADGNTSLPGNLTISHTTSATMTADSTNPKITFAENGQQPVHIIYTDYDNYRSPAGLKIIGGASATPAWLEVEGTVYAAGFNGPLTGNVTGNVSGTAANVTGTVAVGHGGTGATSFTANSVIISGSTTTAALTTRAIKNMTALGDLGWTSAATDVYIPTVNTLAYWNGRYNNSSSNLAYCNKGAFGNAVTYGVDDATANGALGTGTGLTTERSVYYGLVTVNNASQTRATGIYAPTSAGTANQILVSSGGTSAPTWKATANGAAYATGANGALTFGTLPVAQGGTGGTSAATARTNLEINTISNSAIDTIVASSSTTNNTANLMRSAVLPLTIEDTSLTKTSSLINDSGYIVNSDTFNTSSTGTAIGMQSTGNNRFEVAENYKGIFYGGIRSLDVTKSFTITQISGNAIIDGYKVFMNGGNLLIYLDVMYTQSTAPGSIILKGNVKGTWLPLESYEQKGVAGWLGNALAVYSIASNGDFEVYSFINNYGSANTTQTLQMAYIGPKENFDELYR